MKFRVNADKGYILFIPPNLDSEYWELEGQPSIMNGFYAIYPAVDGTVYYTRFDTYLLGYIISLAALMWVIVWYKKENFVRALEKIRIIWRFSG